MRIPVEVVLALQRGKREVRNILSVGQIRCLYRVSPRLYQFGNLSIILAIPPGVCVCKSLCLHTTCIMTLDKIPCVSVCVHTCDTEGWNQDLTCLASTNTTELHLWSTAIFINNPKGGSEGIAQS